MTERPAASVRGGDPVEDEDEARKALQRSIDWQDRGGDAE